MENTKIQWAHHTFNPWRGCAKVAAGCANCYAADQARRNPRILGQWGAGGTRVVASEDQWRKPSRWASAARDAGERHRVFCGSMCDIFEAWDGPIIDAAGEPIRDASRWWGAFDSRPLTADDVRYRVVNEVLATNGALDWLMLTKRPQNARHMLEAVGLCGETWNLWVGASAANQQEADEAWYALQEVTQAAVRFLSLEPLVGPIDLRDVWRNSQVPDWVIVGGESGPNSRPCYLEWLDLVVARCREASVPVFVKQTGKVAVTRDARPYGLPPARWGPWGNESREGQLVTRDTKGGDPAEWPQTVSWPRAFPKGGA